MSSSGGGGGGGDRGGDRCVSEQQPQQQHCILCGEKRIFCACHLYKQTVTSFVARKFYPYRYGSGLLSIFCSNCHVQTIIGSEAIKSKTFGAFGRSFATVEENFKTPDGDNFDVEFSANINDFCKGIVVVLHGLESNIKGPLVNKMASAYIKSGFGCALVSFRGCNGVDNETPGGYHLGFTTDVKQVIAVINSRYSNIPVYISGFSLGGNVALKYVGELGSDAVKHNIKGVVVASVPFDAVASQGKIDVGVNRELYSRAFLWTLKQKAERQIAKFPGSFDIERVRRCNTIGEFDDEFVAKIYNFRDKIDYYEQSGSIRYLKDIRVPSIAINAVDDPFIEANSLPTEADHVKGAPVRLIYQDYGGHCGFLASNNSYFSCFPTRREGNFDSNSCDASCCNQFRSGKSSADDDVNQVSPPQPPDHGWLADEMCRALNHIHNSTALLNIW